MLNFFVHNHMSFLRENDACIYLHCQPIKISLKKNQLKYKNVSHQLIKLNNFFIFSNLENIID